MCVKINNIRICTNNNVGDITTPFVPNVLSTAGEAVLDQPNQRIKLNGTEFIFEVKVKFKLIII